MPTTEFSRNGKVLWLWSNAEFYARIRFGNIRVKNELTKFTAKTVPVDYGNRQRRSSLKYVHDTHILVSPTILGSKSRKNQQKNIQVNVTSIPTNQMKDPQIGTLVYHAPSTFAT